MLKKGLKLNQIDFEGIAVKQSQKILSLENVIISPSPKQEKNKIHSIRLTP